MQAKERDTQIPNYKQATEFRKGRTGDLEVPGARGGRCTESRKEHRRKRLHFPQRTRPPPELCLQRTQWEKTVVGDTELWCQVASSRTETEQTMALRQEHSSAPSELSSSLLTTLHTPCNVAFQAQKAKKPAFL